MSSNTNFSVDSLESLRLRLSQLTHSLTNLDITVKQGKLSNWPSLQAQFNVILTQYSTLTTTIMNNIEFLSSTVTFPLPSFPTKTSSGLLMTLLCKKPLPEIEEWIKQGEKISNNRNDGGNKQKDNLNELLNWAYEYTINEQAQHEWSGYYTKVELLTKDISLTENGNAKNDNNDNENENENENESTDESSNGSNDDSGDSDDSDDSTESTDDDDDMDIDEDNYMEDYTTSNNFKIGMSLDQAIRFMSQGTVPSIPQAPRRSSVSMRRPVLRM